MIDHLRTCLTLMHVLSGAAWFGASFYYLFVLYPRLSSHFEKVAERENFMLALAHGARWQVVTAIGFVGSSGLALALLPRSEVPPSWTWFIAGKTVLLLASAILFWRVSWYWWPARLFALESELPAIHQRFRLGAACMLMMLGANAILGVLCRSL